MMDLRAKEAVRPPDPDNELVNEYKTLNLVKPLEITSFL